MTYTVPPKWTPAELDVLQENYHKHVMAQLLILLPTRTRFGIASKAREMKLKAGKEVFRLRGSVKLHWSDAEIEMLKRLYSIASANELRAALPKRGIRAIHKQAERWGLKRTSDANKKSRSDAAKYTASVNRKHSRIEDAPDPFQTVVIRPAPPIDRHIVFEAIAQRTPLEQAWCGQ